MIAAVNKSIDAILDSVSVFRQIGDGPMFSAEQMLRINACDVSGASLLAIVLEDEQPLARRVAAIEALAQRGSFDWRKSPAESRTVANVLARALSRDSIHNHWGLPGVSVGRSGMILTGSQYGVAEALAPLLDDSSLLMTTGSETATIQALANYRVADLAAWLILKQRHEPWIDADDPTLRDLEIAQLRSRLRERR